tara:strand:+ start:1653 stop:1844 length:192 start_codon:yes stop_codon:yes gene_type:complete
MKTDKVCKKTNFLFCRASDALLIAGMTILLVGIVVINTLNAKAAATLLMLKLNKKISVETNKT